MWKSVIGFLELLSIKWRSLKNLLFYGPCGARKCTDLGKFRRPYVQPKIFFNYIFNHDFSLYCTIDAFWLRNQGWETVHLLIPTKRHIVCSLARTRSKVQRLVPSNRVPPTTVSANPLAPWAVRILWLPSYS